MIPNRKKHRATLRLLIFVQAEETCNLLSPSIDK